MKKCPFCSAEILDESEFCLYCMRQLTPKKTVAAKPKKSYLWVFIVLSVIIVCAIIFLIVKLAPKSHSFTASETSTICNTDIDDDFLGNTYKPENSIDNSSPDNLKTPNNSDANHYGADDNSDVFSGSESANNTTTNNITKDDDNPSLSDKGDSDTNEPTAPNGGNSTDGNSTDNTSNKSDQHPTTTPSEDEKPQNQPIQTWSIKEVDGGIEITGIANHNTTGNYEIPSQIDGKSVIGIGNSAFYNERIKNITLPNTLEYIGEQAFTDCHSITQIVLPQSVTEIRSGAFVSCKNLSDIYIKSTNVEIATYAFSSMYQRNVSLTIHAPVGVVDALFARITWDADYEEWNG